MSQWRARALELFPEMRAEIQSAESAGHLWIELISRLQRRYDPESLAGPTESPKLIRAICLYAIWCTRSESPDTQQAAGIEFYYYLPRFALRCADPIYKRIIRDLIANLGLAEIEKMGGSLKPGDLKRFLADARQAEEERQRRSRKR